MVSCKIPILATRVRFPGGAGMFFFFTELVKIKAKNASREDWTLDPWFTRPVLCHWAIEASVSQVKIWTKFKPWAIAGGTKFVRSRQDSNLRGETPLDFKSNALTTRPRLLRIVSKSFIRTVSVGHKTLLTKIMLQVRLELTTPACLLYCL